MTWATPTLAALVAAIAVPLLVLLYFLKLRRTPREVSSTILWKKSIQDLQANAPFQKLRKNLLLLLQLLILAALLIALAQPRSITTSGKGTRNVILIDRSASMSALDAGDDSTNPIARLDDAKQRARALVESLRAPSLFEDDTQADSAMVVAFGGGAEILAPMTSDKTQLLRAIDSIEPTDAPSSIEDAYRLARSQESSADTAPAVDTPIDEESEAAAPTQRDPSIFHLFSDGRIPDLTAVAADEDAAGAPSVVYHASGKPDAVSIGIVSLQAERDYDNTDLLTIYVGVQSTDPQARTVDAELRVDGRLAAVREVDLAPATINTTTNEPEPSISGVVFELDEPRAVTARVTLITGHHRDPSADALAADNTGHLVVPPSARARVALVTDGSLFLTKAFDVLPIAELDVMTQSTYASNHDAGAMSRYDLIVLDKALPIRDAPDAPLDPGRYLILGAAPEGPEGLTDLGAGPSTQIINWRREHPVLRNLTLDAVVIGKSRLVSLADDSAWVSIAETTDGPAILELSTGTTRAIAVPFDPADSNWPFDLSFVVFLASAVDELGAADNAALGAKARALTPGRVLADRIPPSAEDARVTTPTGDESDVVVAPDGRVVFAPITSAGLYTLSWRGEPGPTDTVEGARATRRYASNLLDAAESNTAARGTLELANTLVSADDAGRVQRLKEWWPTLILAALAIMLFEWWVYNKRVYL